MTVRVRAHHLLCLMTYAGHGYNEAFTANFDAIAARLKAGEDAVVIEGPDDICRPLLDEATPHCVGASVTLRDRQAQHALSLLLERPVTLGERLQLDERVLQQMSVGFARGATRAACAGCNWFSLCSSIAEDNFAGTKIGAR